MKLSIGPRLRAFRRTKNLTQEELAEKSGVANTIISRLETGTITDPRMSTVVRLTEALDISVSELIEIDNGTNSVMNSILERLRGLKEDLQAKFHVREIGLFGSTARGEQKPGSDIDILVTYEEGHRDVFNHSRLESFLEEELDRPVDLVMDSNESLRKHERIKQNIERDLIDV